MRRALSWSRGVRRRVTPGSGRLTLDLWVRGGRGLSLSFFSAFLMVLSHSNGSSLPSSLFIKQVLGAILMYRDSFTFLSCKFLAVSRISTSFQLISWPSCHACSATADLSNAPSLHAALCSTQLGTCIYTSCRNTVGSYKCICETGYILHNSTCYHGIKITVHKDLM